MTPSVERTPDAAATDASPSPEPSESDAPSAPGGGTGPVSQPPPDASIRAPAPVESEGIPVSLGPLGLLGGIDLWIVPGLLFGMPGLLVALFVLLQAGGATAWIPAIQRLRGEEHAATSA